MHAFHYQVVRGLRPVLSKLRPRPADLDRTIYAYAELHLARSCVANTVFQVQRTNLRLPECPYVSAEFPPSFPLQVFVLHRTLTKIHKAVSTLLQINPVQVDVDIDGSPNMLQSIHSLFQRAKSHRLPLISIMTEDVVLKCKFDEELKSLLGNTRCTGHLFTRNFGGVLSLGAREWTEADWSLIDVGYLAKSRSICYNTGKNSLATFAVIFSNSTFDAVLTWLSTHVASNVSFSSVLAYLSDLGHVVRTAYPYLAIQNVHFKPVFEGGAQEAEARIATAADRERVHKWDTLNFCSPLAEPPAPTARAQSEP
jgi:hypothetical protein